MIRASLSFVAILLLVAPAAQAQLRITLNRTHSEVLQYEAMPVQVTIVNDTELDAHFGRYAPEARMILSLRQRRYTGSEEIVDQAPMANAVLRQGQRETYDIDLSKYFDIKKVGRYVVGVKVEWMGRTYGGGEAVIDVVPGMELRTIEKSVPYDPSDVRTYSLRYWQRSNSQHLFLLVTNEERKQVFGVFDLGRFVRTETPTIEFDRIGRVHVCHLVVRDVIAHTYLLSDRSGVWVWKRKYRDSYGNELQPGGFVVREAEPVEAEDATEAPAAPAAEGDAAPKKSRYLFKRLFSFGKNKKKQ